MNKLSMLLLLLAVLAVASADTVMPTFREYVQKHGKKFANEDELIYRQNVYEENVKKMVRNNNDPTKTHTEYPNDFTLWTEEEFANTMLRAIPPKKESTAAAVAPIVGTWAPTDVDWTATANNKVTGVRNQGNCGSCWAFSAVAAIESLTYLVNSTAKDYSEQQLTSCSKSNSGCNGGWMITAYDYIVKAGLVAEATYPYTSGSTGRSGSCSNNKLSPVAVRILGSTSVSATCTAVAAELINRPLSVAVAASGWGGYSGGIFSSCDTSINHGVLLVGVTSTYWRIKNSWGGSWGEAGFIRLPTADGASSCRVCDYASYPYV